MSEGWSNFVVSLIASFLGAGLGVFLTLSVNRCLEKRTQLQKAQEIRIKLREEVLDNCSTLDSLFETLGTLDNTVKERKPLPTPFLLAKLPSDSYQYAVQNNLITPLDKITQSSISSSLGHYYEHCAGFNSLLSTFEEYVSHFLTPFPEPDNESLWKITEEDVLRRTKELRPVLVSELKHSLFIAERLGAPYDQLSDYKTKLSRGEYIFGGSENEKFKINGT
jgi:hypothetical protein